MWMFLDNEEILMHNAVVTIIFTTSNLCQTILMPFSKTPSIIIWDATITIYLKKFGTQIRITKVNWKKKIKKKKERRRRRRKCDNNISAPWVLTFCQVKVWLVYLRETSPRCLWNILLVLSYYSFFFFSP